MECYLANDLQLLFNLNLNYIKSNYIQWINKYVSDVISKNNNVEDKKKKKISTKTVFDNFKCFLFINKYYF